MTSYEIHTLRTYNEKMCADSSTGKTQITHNLFGPSAQIGKLFEIFLKKAPHHMSFYDTN
jgi:hypothetical protein